MEKIKAEAIARARAQIAARIACYCRNLSPEEFEALLDRMAGIQYKYDCVEEIPNRQKSRAAPESTEQE